MTAFTFAARLADLQSAGSLTIHAGGHTLALFLYGGRVYAVDNRCPHMGFPLDRGTVKDGLLTCYWHYARFDLTTGGAFDQFADDVRAFPVEVRGGDVWVDTAPPDDPRAHYRQRLNDGLERNLALVIAKSTIALLDLGLQPIEPFQAGLDFGGRYREAGWGQGLTMHTCCMNLLPHLDAEDQPRALYHGLSAVAANTAGSPPRFTVQPLPGGAGDLPALQRWFRKFVDVRDAEGAERCLVSAVRAGADARRLADMLFAAATDHRYLQTGHPLDFTNKALEALDRIGWGDRVQVERVLTSLVSGYANGDRMEESNAWRNPVDLVAIVEVAFEELAGLPAPPAAGQADRAALTPILLGDDPQAIADALLAALRAGCPADDLAGAVAQAAALRIARFNTSNEFGDWDTALHTFTFANAVHQGLRRLAPAAAAGGGLPPLARGIFDAAMSVYLDRFLNVPAAPLPAPTAGEPADAAQQALETLPGLLNQQQQVDAAGALAARYLYAGGRSAGLLALLGKLLLREDRDFHTIQCVEAAVRQFNLRPEAPDSVYFLVAATRYLAAHSPTMRAEGQTYTIAYRLSRGEKLFEG